MDEETNVTAEESEVDFFGDEAEEVTEPVEETETAEETPEEVNEPEEQAEQPVPQMTPEQYRQQFENNALMREFVGAYGKENPYTGQPVRTIEDYKQYKAQYAEDMKRVNTQNFLNEFANGDLTPEAFNQFINNAIENHPSVMAAKQAQNQFKQAEQTAKVENGRQLLQSDIKKLNEEIPNCSIKSINDLERDTAVLGYLRRGLNVSDAYFLAHRNDIEEQRAAGVRQAVINQSNGKAHLTTTNNSTQGGMTVPDDVMREYKAFYPDMTDKEIRTMYAKTKKLTI